MRNYSPSASSVGRLRSPDYRPRVEALEDRLAPGEILPVVAPELLTLVPVFTTSDPRLGTM